MKRLVIAFMAVAMACRKEPAAIDSTQRALNVPVPSRGTAATPTARAERDLFEMPRRAKQDPRKLGVRTGAFGPYVVDANGRSLYILSIDDAGQTACMTNCATVWPPAIVEKIPGEVDAQIDASKLTLIRRDEGTMQLALNGHPLYFSESDFKAGDVWGHYAMSFGGRFTLISPAGQPAPPPR